MEKLCTRVLVISNILEPQNPGLGNFQRLEWNDWPKAKDIDDDLLQDPKTWNFLPRVLRGYLTKFGNFCKVKNREVKFSTRLHLSGASRATLGKRRSAKASVVTAEKPCEIHPLMHYARFLLSQNACQHSFSCSNYGLVSVMYL